MILKKLPAVLVSLILIIGASVKSSTAPVIIPNPVLVFNGPKLSAINGKKFTRYNFFVENSADFPKELFAASPDLPPCGKNRKAARTWLDFYDSTGKRLNEFCALSGPKDLKAIWFALEPNVIPPSYVYIELNDRQTSTKYKSNLAETTQ
jgi:hypothetical protein